MVAFRAHVVGVGCEAPREGDEKDNTERNERHKRKTKRWRARMEGDARREHRDDCAEKARVESAHEPAHRIRVARQLCDERTIGEWRKFRRGEIHHSI